jgi:hypothetical protein
MPYHEIISPAYFCPCIPLWSLLGIPLQCAIYLDTISTFWHLPYVHIHTSLAKTFRCVPSAVVVNRSVLSGRLEGIWFVLVQSTGKIVLKNFHDVAYINVRCEDAATALRGQQCARVACSWQSDGIIINLLVAEKFHASFSCYAAIFDRHAGHWFSERELGRVQLQALIIIICFLLPRPHILHNQLFLKVCLKICRIQRQLQSLALPIQMLLVLG